MATKHHLEAFKTMTDVSTRMMAASFGIAQDAPAAVSVVAGDYNDLQSKTTQAIGRNMLRKLSAGEPVPLSMESVSRTASLHGLMLKMTIAATHDVWRHLLSTGARFTQAQIAANQGDPEPLVQLFEQRAQTLRIVGHENPAAIERVKSRSGIHVERTDEYTLIAETPRLKLYKVHPLKAGVTTDDTLKPVLFEPPTVLGDAIMALLPYDGVSLIHYFANRSVPTYIVRFNDITVSPEMADMTVEEWIEDMAEFLSVVNEMHHQPVYGVGVCQGAHLTKAGSNSDRWNGLMDDETLIVMPADLSTSEKWREIGEATPEFMAHSTDMLKVKLPHGGEAVCGASVALAMRMLGGQNMVSALVEAMETEVPLNDFAAAVQAWLSHVVPLPHRITEFSRRSAEVPIRDDDTVSYTLFDEEVNALDAFTKGGIKHIHLIAGSSDEVVPPDAALKFVEVPAAQAWLARPENAGRITHYVFKGGHIKHMTSATIEGKDVEPGGVAAPGGVFHAYQIAAGLLAAE